MAMLFNAAQIREWDQYTIRFEPIASIELMERASRACVQWIAARWPDTHTNFVVFCGTGNNGGDGLAIARLLLERAYHVEIYLVGSGQRSPDNEANLNELRYLFPVGLHAFSDGVQLDMHTVLIDAIFGTGLNRVATGEEKQAIEFLNSCPQQRVSIDIPSGLPADTLLDDIVAVRADYTLSFQQYKASFLFLETGIYCGEIVVLDIKLHPAFPQTLACRQFVIDEVMVKQLYKKRSVFGHKGTYGHALLLGGSHGKMGACVLAAEACLKSGSGLLTVLVPEAENMIVQISVPEAMTVHELSILKREEGRINAIGVGPGMGSGPAAYELLSELLAMCTQPLILDADALNLLAAYPDLWSHIPEGSLLTPHPKEFDRLFGEQANSYTRHAQLTKEATRRGVFILLKGHHSCLATPQGESYFNCTGNAGLAKGGSGDVLTGMLTGLYAQYRDIRTAAILGMYLHGLAGDLAVENGNMEALCARDIIATIGAAINQIAD